MRDSIIFCLNGTRHQVAGDGAFVPLVEYLGGGRRLTCTKMIVDELAATARPPRRSGGPRVLRNTGNRIQSRHRPRDSVLLFHARGRRRGGAHRPSDRRSEGDARSYTDRWWAADQPGHRPGSRRRRIHPGDGVGYDGRVALFRPRRAAYAPTQQLQDPECRVCTSGLPGGAARKPGGDQVGAREPRRIDGAWFRSDPPACTRRLPARRSSAIWRRPEAVRL
jgi:hypothetical protein